MEEQEHIKMSVTLSALGWVFSVVVFALAIYIGKPYFFNAGYMKGINDAKEANIKIADEIVRNRVIEGENYVVYGRIVEKGEQFIIIEAMTPYLNNPLRDSFRRQKVNFDENTDFEKRELLPFDQFIQVLEQARAAGLRTDQVQQSINTTITLADLQIGDDIRVYPYLAQDANKDEYLAKTIVYAISNQETESTLPIIEAPNQ